MCHHICFLYWISPWAYKCVIFPNLKTLFLGSIFCSFDSKTHWEDGLAISSFSSISLKPPRVRPLAKVTSGLQKGKCSHHFQFSCFLPSQHLTQLILSSLKHFLLGLQKTPLSCLPFHPSGPSLCSLHSFFLDFLSFPWHLGQSYGLHLHIVSAQVHIFLASPSPRNSGCRHLTPYSPTDAPELISFPSLAPTPFTYLSPLSYLCLGCSVILLG